MLLLSGSNFRRGHGLEPVGHFPFGDLLRGGFLARSPFLVGGAPRQGRPAGFAHEVGDVLLGRGSLLVRNGLQRRCGRLGAPLLQPGRRGGFRLLLFEFDAQRGGPRGLRGAGQQRLPRFVLQPLEADCRVGYFVRFEDRPDHERRIGVQRAQPLTVNLCILGTRRAGQHLHQDAQGVQAMGIFLQQLGCDFRRLYLVPGTQVSACQHHLQIGAVGVIRQNSADLRNRLIEEFPLSVHIRQRLPAQADLGRLYAVPPAVEAAQFGLDGRVGRLHLEGALHVPDGVIEFTFIVLDDAHPHMGYKIIRSRIQDSLENVSRIGIPTGLQERLAEQPVGLNVHRKGLENVLAMGDGLIQLSPFNHAFNFAVVSTQGYFGHGILLHQLCPILPDYAIYCHSFHKLATPSAALFIE